MPELKKLDLVEPAPAKTSTTPTTPTTPATPTASSSTTTTKTTPKLFNPPMFAKIGLPILAIILGVGTGYLTASYLTTGQLTPSTISSEIPASGVKVGDIIGVPDAKTFKDSAEGVLDKGGLDGEGSHSLLRAGGPSQTVYLTSSVIDLDELVGHKIKVWGETFKGQKAGWLMDVGRIEVLELNAPKP